uniref:Uncharacterized protein n=1 Tax=Triparma pacifica TaxID=91992 RepID=A0A7S2VWJ4_9STRA|mmetsp:Transcript_823/g.1477  ORF Transcript_823/g.1477 Transcript_823/m.1477 type:complete len:375 (+) Transcript_823:145-1269(+)
MFRRFSSSGTEMRAKVVPSEEPYTGQARSLVLVNKGDGDQCIFTHALDLSRGKDVDLTLSSHPGLVIGRQYGDERMAGPWRYIESGIKANVQPICVQYVEGNYIKLTDADLVFDVSFWKMESGNTVNFVGGTNENDKTKLGGGGRDWVINSDGTISPKHHLHLTLGVQAPKMVLVAKDDPCQLTFKNASCLRDGEEVELSLSSHYEMGVARAYNEEKRFGPWRFTESCISSSSPIRVSYVDSNFIMLADADLVFDVSFWKMEPGNTVNFVGGTNAKEKTMLGGGGRDWIIDDDGSISPKRHSHLSLGCCLESSPEPEIAVVQLPPPTAPPIAVAVALPLEGGGEGEATRCDKCNGCITREMKFCPECGMRNTKI